MHSSTFWAIAAIAASAPIGGAQAAVLASQTVQFNSSYTHDASTGGNTHSQTPTLTLLDYSGTGTLTGVEISVTDTALALGFVTNETGNNPNIYEDLQSQRLVYGGAGGPSALRYDDLYPVTSANSDFGQQLFTGIPPGGTELYSGGLSGSYDTIITSPEDLADFIGSGAYVLDTASDVIEITTYNNPKHPEGAAFSYDVFDFGSLTVTYLGDPLVAPPPPPATVPEPASWSLMLLGVAGLGAAIRSRRRQLNAMG